MKIPFPADVELMSFSPCSLILLGEDNRIFIAFTDIATADSDIIMDLGKGVCILKEIAGIPEKAEVISVHALENAFYILARSSETNRNILWEYVFRGGEKYIRMKINE